MDIVDIEVSRESGFVASRGRGGGEGRNAEGLSSATILSLRCRRESVAGEPLSLVAELDIAELCAMAGFPPADGSGRTDIAAAGGDAAVLLDPRRRLVLVNGWQSWSFAGELAAGERPRRALLKPQLNLFVDHPAEAAVRQMARRGGQTPAGARGPAIVSHFFTVLRAGSLRLALVSLGDRLMSLGAAQSAANPAGAADCVAADAGRTATRTLPPVTFFIGPKTVRVAVYAEGASFRAGETVARIAVLGGGDYFALKDKLAEVFGAAGRLDSLAFLGAVPASPGVRRSPIGGFETWYNHYLDISEPIIRRDLDALPANGNLINSLFLSKGKPVVFQIDDGWEKCVGDWTPHADKFPEGVAGLARDIEARGLIPGLWLAPFLVMPDSGIARSHPEWLLRGTAGTPVIACWNPGWGGEVYCLDLSQPAVEEYLAGLFDTIVNEWGFRYLKLDFLYAGMSRGVHAGGGTRAASGPGANAGAAWEHYERVLRRITSIASDRRGRPVAWLACGAPIETTAPLMPLMRIGADTRETWDWPLLRLVGHQGRPSAKVNLGHTFARSLLDGTLLLNDPDVVFCRDRRIALGDSEKFVIGLAAKMFASQILFSDDPAEFGQTPGAAAASAASPASPATSASAPGAAAPANASMRPPAGSMAEFEFTSRILSLYGALGDREFGVERYSLSSPDLYRFFSRDGAIHGIINLSDRGQVLETESPAGAPVSAFAPRRSIVLFGLEEEESGR
jgi:alpha-galactosidase